MTDGAQGVQRNLLEAARRREERAAAYARRAAKWRQEARQMRRAAQRLDRPDASGGGRTAGAPVRPGHGGGIT